MRRLVEPKLREWRDAQRRKPLIVRGARQVGKTHSVEEFGRNCFENLVTIDLERNRPWHRVFLGNLDAGRILSELEILGGGKITPGKTLLFLDEIQSCPRAIMALRYLYEEYPALHVIAAGSLLEFALTDISFPVGRVQFLDMHPLTLAEYLWAIGKDAAAEIVLSPPQQFGESVHNLLLDEVRRYFFVGGMPESVQAYADTRSMQESFAVQQELCDSFRQDFSKYAPRADKYCLDAVFTGIARNTGRQIKYTRLAEGYSHPTIRRAFEILCMARLAQRVPSATPSGLPLGATASPKRFKALMLDIGLCQCLCGVKADAEYQKTDLLAIHEGAMAEQFAGQEMTVSQGSGLHYWAREVRGSSAEVDYLVAMNGQIHPVEVKSGPAGRLKSLHLLLESYPNCPQGLVLSSAPSAELPEQKIMFLPLYYAYAATRPDTHSLTVPSASS